MMMSTVASIGLVCLIWKLLRVRRAIVGTTLIAAWAWGLVAVATWTAAQLAAAIGALAGAGQDRLWYAATVLTVCPFIAVLGARNPGARAWTGFVMVPLILVLSWPAIATLIQNSTDPLVLQGPAVLGFGVAMLMGGGNYVGTRFTIPAAGVAIAFAIQIGSLMSGPEIRNSSEWASLILVGSGLMACGFVNFWHRDANNVPDHIDRYDPLWADFRDFYGMVWAKRVLDRLNHLFERDGLPVRLRMDGFFWSADASKTTADREDIFQKADKSVLWILRRFVDEPWLNARMSKSAASLKLDRSELT